MSATALANNKRVAADPVAKPKLGDPGHFFQFSYADVIQITIWFPNADDFLIAANGDTKLQMQSLKVPEGREIDAVSFSLTEVDLPTTNRNFFVQVHRRTDASQPWVDSPILPNSLMLNYIDTHQVFTGSFLTYETDDPDDASSSKA